MRGGGSLLSGSTQTEGFGEFGKFEWNNNKELYLCRSPEFVTEIFIRQADGDINTQNGPFPLVLHFN